MNASPPAHRPPAWTWPGRRPGGGRWIAGAVLFAACSGDPSGPVVQPPTPPGIPTGLVAVTEVTLVGFAGRPVDVPPAVRVVDGAGAPVAGVSVSFVVDPGSGTTANRDVATGADGVADVGSWVLGPDPGSHRLHASVEGLPTVTFLAVATVPPAVFDIVVRFNHPGGTPAQRLAFRVAESRWQAVIQGDLPDIRVARSAGFCGAVEPLDEVVDDLLILADVVTIDGPGGVLGSAGPCLLRDPGGLPILGRMRFDSADLDALEAGGTLDDVIVHEMGHVLGIGSLWGFFDLVADSATDTPASDPHFTGAAARTAFVQIGGAGYDGDVVPVEDTGGPGTRLVHWRESVFANELMTGFVNQGSNPLSVVTIASLEDMGYVVDRSAAEAYALSLAALPAGGDGVHLGDDLLRSALHVIDARGRIRPLVPR